MGFAWHKLIPRPIEGNYDCPPPCVATGDHTYEICWCPVVPGGPIATTCDVGDYICMDLTVEGPNCNGGQVVLGGVPYNLSGTNGPRELRLNIDLSCTRSNTGDASTLNCVMGEIGDQPFIQPYYYRTPDSPSSMPSTIKSEFLCLKYKTYTVPDRLMFISGRNRYKYSGLLSGDPSCPENINTVIPLWNRDYGVAGITGIKQAEVSLGREWPLPNSVLNLPLFGATTSMNPPPTGKPDRTACDPTWNPSGNTPCSGADCFSVRDNRSYGHYNPSGGSNQNGQGRYSFQCFNPTAFYKYDENSVNTPIPTCSVWGLVEALKERAIDFAGDWSVVQSNHTDLYNALLLFQTKNPHEYTSSVSNVRHCLENLSDEFYSSIGSSLTIPNVFLWDPDGYDDASTTIDKWKHIYIIGNANVIFDTYCIATGNNTKQGFVIHLDEVSHDPEYGSTGNARMIMFWGCDEDVAVSTNNGSIATMDLTTLDCVPTGEEVNQTFCERCQTEDGNVTFLNCHYRGHVEGERNDTCRYEDWA